MRGKKEGGEENGYHLIFFFFVCGCFKNVNGKERMIRRHSN